ncbi:cuticle protein AMP1B-like [Panulirus ornatus]|uniref:cuticle protein AMP1B-like n=1 Tax=Panulirus ornatus TaxID=150431 RepID=UPI003A84CF0E
MRKVVLMCLVTVVCAAPPPPTTYGAPPEPPQHTYGQKPVAVIVTDEREGPDAQGNYRFNFESSDGIKREEQGAPQGDEGAVGAQGGWSFTFPDGTPGHFTFVADAEGFKVESDLLPVPPPLPPHAIAQIEKAAAEDAAAASAPQHQYGAPPPSPAYG